ncbi:hypothetical protein [Janthinobacterium fluminis]|uniref:Uncharacterized protein n=1 Tax=Janthinobacterium fluminis TaxID=2987524 RepID=A0ABT5K3D3_9BURK|nr:hypothetical protein [Janthinobacterium fluminis]MDC8758247.1 hypothetical protein [Janthinobacterium fluminis]
MPKNTSALNKISDFLEVMKNPDLFIEKKMALLDRKIPSSSQPAPPITWGISPDFVE